MKKRPKPQRRVRQRIDRLTHRHHTLPGRRFDVYPAPWSPLKVEVRVTRSRRRMRESVGYHDGSAAMPHACRLTMGLCRSYSSTVTGRPVIRPRGIVARIWLNARDLATAPGELVSHECAHAAMAWARLRRANLRHMAGEEVMCYALGRLTQQVTNVLYGMGMLG